MEWLAGEKTLLQRSGKINNLLFLKDNDDYRWRLFMRSLRVIISIPFLGECGSDAVRHDCSAFSMLHRTIRHQAGHLEGQDNTADVWRKTMLTDAQGRVERLDQRHSMFA
jgi:hypothetical protein